MLQYLVKRLFGLIPTLLIVGVLVFMFPKVPLTQVRGVTFPLFPMPAIGINSKETSAGARSFTLMHELAHVALVWGNEETVALQENRTESSWQELERFAEEVASSRYGY